jgi:hypothetical protein
MWARSCVNSYCKGTNNVIFPVRNQPSNPGDRNYNPYPAYCTRDWWIDTRGSTFDSGCTTGWVLLDHCQRPNGAQFAECPANDCGNGVCESRENGSTCAQDCCDWLTPCGQSKQNQGTEYCRSMNTGGYTWITEATAATYCSTAAQVCHSTYACGGTNGICSAIGAWTQGGC